MNINHQTFQLTRRKKRIIIFSCMALFIFAFVFSIIMNLKKRRHVENLRREELLTQPVQSRLTTVVQKKTIFWQRRYSAKVEPRFWISVGPEISGTI
ncbi:MAG: hypothetical protein Q8Q33_03570, partial [Chlamydiota bacterium]|nr:hypothetical protein [Chlamydiota bacterium]